MLASASCSVCSAAESIFDASAPSSRASVSSKLADSSLSSVRNRSIGGGDGATAAASGPLTASRASSAARSASSTSRRSVRIGRNAAAFGRATALIGDDVYAASANVAGSTVRCTAVCRPVFCA